MRKFFSGLLLLCSVLIAGAQEISPYLVGTNVWLPPWMGGKWHELKDDLGDAGYQLIRIGGNGAQSASAYTNVRIADLVEDIRAQGAEPMVQVPYTHTAQQTTEMIDYINGTRALNVKYWAIGNEPNHQPKVDVSVVAAYTRRIASALKAYDPAVKTLGPTLAWWDTSYMNPLFVQKGVHDISGADENGHYYIDIISWNTYALTYGMGYNNTISQAVNLVNTLNQNRLEESRVGWAILEFNGHWDNLVATDAQKCWSFNTGQMFAEMYDIGMRRGAVTMANWSIYEGGGNRSQGDLGLFDGLGANLGSAARGRSSYYHALMLGRHMKSNYLPNAHNGPIPNGENNGITVISMGDEDGFSVMLINRSASQSYTYNIGLNNEYGTTAPLRIRVDAGIDSEVNGQIKAKTTQMMVFDAEGNMRRFYEFDASHAENFCGPLMVDYSDATAAEGHVRFISPGNGIMKKSSHRLLVNVEASHPAGIDAVDLFIGQRHVSTITEPPYSWDNTHALLDGLLPGFYELSAVAHITGGSTITKTINFGNVLSNAPEEPILIPGKVEAEHYDVMQGILTQPVNDEGGGLYVTNISTGNWMDYVVDVTETGQYEVSFRVSGWTNTGRIALRNAAGETLASAAIPNRGPQQFQNWTDVEGDKPFWLQQGRQTLRIYAVAQPFNINHFTINTSTTGVDPRSGSDAIRIFPQPFHNIMHIEGVKEFSSLRVYTTSGQLLKQIANPGNNAVLLNLGSVPAGVHVLWLGGLGNVYTQPIIKIDNL